jgi:hypothetical protein
VVVVGVHYVVAALSAHDPAEDAAFGGQCSLKHQR